jgi:hypothetical protein
MLVGIIHSQEYVMSKRNPIAQDLRTPKYRPRIVKSKRIYNRKAKHEKTNDIRRVHQRSL